MESQFRELIYPVKHNLRDGFFEMQVVVIESIVSPNDFPVV